MPFAENVFALCRNRIPTCRIPDMTKPRTPRDYCGARPPSGRATATCILSRNHVAYHRNMDGIRWPVEDEAA